MFGGDLPDGEMKWNEKTKGWKKKRRKTSKTGTSVGGAGVDGAWEPVCCQAQKEHWSRLSIPSW